MIPGGSIPSPRATPVTENITATIWDVPTKVRKLKMLVPTATRREAAKRGGMFQPRQKVSILMPEGDFHFQLPAGEVQESSALLHGQTWILLVPEFPLSSWQSTARAGAWGWRCSRAIKAAVIPQFRIHSLCFPSSVGKPPQCNPVLR